MEFEGVPAGEERGKGRGEYPLREVSPCCWEIPAEARPGMRVPARVFADRELLEKIRQDGSLEQVCNGATLPGIVGASLAMPDIHYGYGLPVGGVVATRVDGDGVVSPGGVGFDINCGVRLLRTHLTLEEVREKVPALVRALFRDVPCGLGRGGMIRLGKGDRKRLAEGGARFALERGFGEESWVRHLEAEGSLPGADADRVSERAWSRGSDQLGSLGSGNHFLEIQVVEEVYQPAVAEAYGLFGGQVCVMIHTGSRGLGHQVCTDFLADMDRTLQRYKIHLPDRQLACAPLSSPEARDYWAAMTCAANFAFANRQCIAGQVAEVFRRVLEVSPRDLGMGTVYDVAHNIVKVEEHEVDGERVRVAVHRKGATRAFPPGHPELGEAYRAVGQPVLIPGDMGRYSFVLAGAEGSMRLSFGSTCHGAGRAMSRKAALRAARGRSIIRELEAKGISVQARGRGTIAEEMSEAYKDAARVVEVVERAGLSKTVAKLRPLGVVKG